MPLELSFREESWGEIFEVSFLESGLDIFDINNKFNTQMTLIHLAPSILQSTSLSEK
jgi:hypothetical protein